MVCLFSLNTFLFCDLHPISANGSLFFCSLRQAPMMLSNWITARHRHRYWLVTGHRHCHTKKKEHDRSNCSILSVRGCHSVSKNDKTNVHPPNFEVIFFCSSLAPPRWWLFFAPLLPPSWGNAKVFGARKNIQNKSAAAAASELASLIDRFFSSLRAVFLAVTVGDDDGVGGGKLFPW